MHGLVPESEIRQGCRANARLPRAGSASLPVARPAPGCARVSRLPCLSSPTNPLSGLCSEPLFLKLRWKCTLFWGTRKDSRLLGDRWARDGFRLGHNHLPLFFLPSGAKRGRGPGRGAPLRRARPIQPFFLLDGGGNLGLAKRRLFLLPILSTVWKALVFFFWDSSSFLASALLISQAFNPRRSNKAAGGRGTS